MFLLVVSKNLKTVVYLLMKYTIISKLIQSIYVIQPAVHSVYTNSVLFKETKITKWIKIAQPLKKQCYQINLYYYYRLVFLTGTTEHKDEQVKEFEKIFNLFSGVG